MSSHRTDGGMGGWNRKIADAIGVWLWRAIMTGMGAAALFWGKAGLNALVAQTPEMIANKADIMVAKVDVAAARSAADSAHLEAQQTTAALQRISEAIKQVYQKQQEADLKTATLIEHVTGIEKQVDRMEAKADAR